MHLRQSNYVKLTFNLVSFTLNIHLQPVLFTASLGFSSCHFNIQQVLGVSKVVSHHHPSRKPIYLLCLVSPGEIVSQDVFSYCFHFVDLKINIGLSGASDKLCLILDLNYFKLLSSQTYGSRFAFYMLNEPPKNEGRNVLRIILPGTLQCVYHFCILFYNLLSDFNWLCKISVSFILWYD